MTQPPMIPFIALPTVPLDVRTRSQVKQDDVERRVSMYMPTLEHLKEASMAVITVFRYAYKHVDTSDVWAWHWFADREDAPYNTFANINFITSNEKMIEQSIEFIIPLQTRIANNSLTTGEAHFAHAWIIAHKMLKKLDDLTKNAPEWIYLAKYSEYSSS